MQSDRIPDYQENMHYLFSEHQLIEISNVFQGGTELAFSNLIILKYFTLTIFLIFKHVCLVKGQNMQNMHNTGR